MRAKPLEYNGAGPRGRIILQETNICRSLANSDY
jgi:hypothetical protein